MDALEAIQTRNSAARLAGTVKPDDLDQMIKAGLRAPDHALLRPWKILVIEGEARERLGTLFAQAKLVREPDLAAEQLAKLKNKPFRAPLILVVAACLTEHPKVPEIEQLSSAAAVAQNIMIAAHALGYGAIWRTGSMAYDQVVTQGLGLLENEKVIGFLYIGEAEGNRKSIPEHDLNRYVTRW